MVKSFELETRNKIGQLVEHTTDMLLCANIFFRKMQNNDRLYRELSLMIESYILYRLYDKIFLGLRILNEADDIVINKVITQINSSENIRSYLGINPEFLELNFDTSISKLDTLTECKTPLQMIYLLEEVFEQGIISIAENHRKKFTKSQNQEPITADDLLPIIAYVICQSSYKYFNSTLFYVENFIYADISTTKLAFILINFRAALSFLIEQKPEVSLDPSSRTRSLLLPNIHSTNSRSSPNIPQLESPTSKNPAASILRDESRMTAFGRGTSQMNHNKSTQRPPTVINVNKDDRLSYLINLGNNNKDL